MCVLYAVNSGYPMSNFRWCLDCEKDDCIVQTSGIINKNY